MQSDNKKKSTQEELKEALKKKIIVWLDDLRNPKDYGVCGYWVKNFTDFKILFNKAEKSQDPSKICITEVHLDNDLGCDADGTGYDALLLIEEKLYFGGLDSLKTIYVHTSNPSAAQKMISVKEVFKEKYGVDVIRNN